MRDRHLNVLDNVRVAAPCPMKWDDMEGEGAVRHCGECRLNVYDLSGMTRGEAERLVREREGRLCVTFFRRADGTIVTRDCPVGLRALRRRARWMWARVAAGIGLLVPTALAFAGMRTDNTRLRTLQPFATISDVLAPAAPAPVPPPVRIAGEMMIAPGPDDGSLGCDGAIQ